MSDYLRPAVDGPPEVRRALVKNAQAMCDAILRWQRNCSAESFNPDERHMVECALAFQLELGRVT